MAAVVTPGIDPAWLSARAREDPVRHAWAVWDLLHYPDRVTFFTLREDGAPTAYLLIWRGALPLQAVHWIGNARDPGPLLSFLPNPPFLATVPLELVDAVARHAGVAPAVVQLRVFELERAAPPEVEGRARPLGASDAAALHAFGQSGTDRLAAAYRAADPVGDRVYGAFVEGHLASAARVQVALPDVWLIGGVATRPEYRNLGLATDVTRLIVRRALAAGARPALYVVESNEVAMRLYDRLGFTLLERRGWIDAAEPG